MLDGFSIPEMLKVREVFAAAGGLAKVNYAFSTPLVT